MSVRDRVPHPDRFENEEDWLDQYDDDPIDARHESSHDRAEAVSLDDLGLDWTNMERHDRLEIDLDHSDDADESGDDEIAA
ncbi:hypothetical protein TA3x_004577 [Tundrisphaera sp. TA3]|uniref:hypothetical protein n=1 Tax=Tundrisphaera sp. TA3 TaxID=3435775 RepID=UPI003EB8F62C